MKFERFIQPLAIILIAVMMRLLPHPANFTPIAAIALFGGVYLDKRYAVILPLLIMVISDFFLGFHQSILFVYGSLVIVSLLGLWLRSHKTVPMIFGASLFSSVIFFLITNFGFWLTDSLYPKTFVGQLEAYYFALPFFRNTLLGDLFYTGLLFGSYALAQRIHFKHLVSKA